MGYLTLYHPDLMKMLEEPFQFRKVRPMSLPIQNLKSQSMLEFAMLLDRGCERGLLGLPAEQEATPALRATCLDGPPLTAPYNFSRPLLGDPNFTIE